MHRSAFPAALTWLELRGEAPEAVEMWKVLKTEAAAAHPDDATAATTAPRRRRRRRRRRGPPFGAL